MPLPSHRSVLAKSTVILAVLLFAGCKTGGTRSHSDRASIGSVIAYEGIPRMETDVVASPCVPGGTMCSMGRKAQSSPDGAEGLLLWDRGTPLYRIHGSHPEVIGGLGSGPGEYRMIMAAGISPSGDVLVFDAAQQRLLRYDPSGHSIGTHRLTLPPGLITGSFVRGELWAVAGDITPNASAGDSLPVAVFAIDTTGAAPRRLSTLPIRLPTYAIGTLRPTPGLFEAAPQWALLEDGQLYFAPGTRLLIDRFDREGGRVSRFGFETAARTVTEAEVNREIEARLRQVVDRRMAEAMRAQLSRPGMIHPAVTSLRALANGEVWVREAPVADSVRWIVFDSLGSAVGAVTLDAAAMVLASRDSLVLVNDPNSSDPGRTLTWVRIKRPGPHR